MVFLFVSTLSSMRFSVYLNKLNTLQFFGDYYIRVIPVPMPNTEVKLYVPTILGGFLPGKIGLRQFFYFYAKFKFSKHWKT